MKLALDASSDSEANIVAVSARSGGLTFEFSNKDARDAVSLFTVLHDICSRTGSMRLRELAWPADPAQLSEYIDRR